MIEFTILRKIIIEKQLSDATKAVWRKKNLV